MLQNIIQGDFEITEKDRTNAFTEVKLLATIMLIAKSKKLTSKARERIK